MIRPSNHIAMSATLHCLTGCAIGEVIGMILGTFLSWTSFATVSISILLAFLFGYTLSLLPLLKIGLNLRTAMPLVLAADTLSILTMEAVDNATVVLIPGALNAGLGNMTFWLSLILGLFLAFWAAFPVNRWLLGQGKGHALVHKYHQSDKHHH